MEAGDQESGPRSNMVEDWDTFSKQFEQQINEQEEKGTVGGSGVKKGEGRKALIYRCGGISKGSEEAVGVCQLALKEMVHPDSTSILCGPLCGRK